MKSVIVSGLKGSSWGFKRFESLSVIATAVTQIFLSPSIKEWNLFGLRKRI